METLQGCLQQEKHAFEGLDVLRTRTLVVLFLRLGCYTGVREPESLTRRAH